MSAPLSVSENALRERIERLEALVALLSGGGAGVISFAGPIVANEPAMRALALPSGEQVFVLSHRSIWTKINGTAGVTPGVPPLKANEIDAADDGTGVYMRTTYSDPSWRLGTPNIHINPSAPGASNENDGFTAATPLASGAEFSRRWGRRNTVRGNPVGAISRIMIHVHSSILNPDYLELDAVCALGTVVEVHGEGTVVLFAGVLDGVGGFTAEVPGAAAGGTAAMIKVGATVWAGFIGDRIRFPATGAVAAILKDLGAGSARVNQPSDPGGAFDFGTPTLISPANGSAFVVESLVSVNWGNIHLTAESGDPAFNFGTGLVKVFDVNAAGVGGNGPALGPIVDGPGLFQMALYFYGCTFDQLVNISKNVAYCSCTARGGINSSNPEPSTGAWVSGAVVATALSFNWAAIWGAAGLGSDLGFAGTFSASPYFQGIGLALFGDGFMNDVAVFDAPGLGGVNPGGHAIEIGGGTSFGVAPANWKIRGKVWGNGSVGRGIHIASNCSFSYHDAVAGLPNITGAAGDFMLAVSSSTWFFAVGTATYQPAAGPIPNTWANLAAAQPAGFGGSAHEPDRNAHLVLEALS